MKQTSVKSPYTVDISVDTNGLQEALSLAEQLKQTLEQIARLMPIIQPTELPDVYVDRNDQVYTRVSSHEYKKTSLHHPMESYASQHDVHVAMLTDMILNNKDALREVTKHFL